MCVYLDEFLSPSAKIFAVLIFISQPVPVLDVFLAKQIMFSRYTNRSCSDERNTGSISCVFSIVVLIIEHRQVLPDNQQSAAYFGVNIY